MQALTVFFVGPLDTMLYITADAIGWIMATAIGVVFLTMVIAIARRITV